MVNKFYERQCRHKKIKVVNGLIIHKIEDRKEMTTEVVLKPNILFVRRGLSAGGDLI